MANHQLHLTERDVAMLAGEMGAATQMAMRILAAMAGVYGAESLLDIESAHIDGCLYHGLSGLCLLYTSPSPRDRTRSRMPSSA